MSPNFALSPRKTSQIAMPRTRTRIADQLLKTLEEIEKEDLLITETNLQNFHVSTNNNEHKSSTSRHGKSHHHHHHRHKTPTAETEDFMSATEDNANENTKRTQRQSCRTSRKRSTESKPSSKEKPKNVALTDFEECEDELSVVAEQLKVIQESQDVLLADIRLDMEQLQLDNHVLRDENARLEAEKNHWEALYCEMCQNTKTMRDHIQSLQSPHQSKRDLTYQEPQTKASENSHHRKHSHERRSDNNRRNNSAKKITSNPFDEENSEDAPALSEVEWVQGLQTRTKRKSSEVHRRSPSASSSTFSNHSRSRPTDENDASTTKGNHDRRRSFSIPPPHPPPDERRPSSRSRTENNPLDIENNDRQSLGTPDSASITSSQIYSAPIKESSSSIGGKGQAGCFGFLRKNKRKKHKKHKLLAK